MKLFNFSKKKLKEIDDRREVLESNAADLMDRIGRNEVYIKAKNEGADKLVALGIRAGIAIAESQTGQDINIDQETINKIADKGGDVVVSIWDRVINLFKIQLRK